MTTYRFLGGLNTIGGNIVEIRTAKARVLCDFGLTVAGQTPEHQNGLSETENFIQSGSLPSVEGLYDTKEFKELSLTSYNDCPIETAIFISHLHLDHMGGLRHLPKETKVYLSKDAYTLYNELIRIGEDKPVDCELIPFEYKNSITIGDIKVLPKHSDHDTVGCSAFFIETPELKIIHSGDFRLSGDHPERVLKWAEEAKQWETDILLIEGTSFSFREEKTHDKESNRKILTESTLLNELEDLITMKAEELFFFNPYIRNVERLRSVDSIVRSQNRAMVWEADYAHILNTFYPEEKWIVLEETVAGNRTQPIYIERTVSLEQLQKNPELYVLQNSFKNLNFLKTFNEGVYLHSNGEPLGDYDPRYAELKAFLESQGIEFVSLGASGHAAQENLLKVAQIVQAKYTLPWHTFSPEAFYEAIRAENLGSFMPEYEREYQIVRTTG